MSSKYFSLPLSETQREKVSRILGLYSWNFALREVSHGETLRCSVVRDETLRYTLDEPRDLEIFQVDHSRPNARHGSGLTLWREIVCHPFSLLPDVETSSTADLWNSLRALEELFFGSELSVLRLSHSVHGEVNLLFHYVRSRCVRVGLTDWPREFGTKAQLFELHTGELKTPTATAQAIDIIIKNSEFQTPPTSSATQVEGELVLSSPDFLDSK